MRKTLYICVTRWNIAKEDTKNGILPSDPLGARTQDPNIKSVVLYQLS